MVIFPDVESLVIAYLKDVLDSDVLVATKKPGPDAEQPARQVIVNAAYNRERDRVLKVASLTLHVYGEGSVATSAFALEVEAKIRGVATDEIKRAIVMLGPVRVAEESQMEKRLLDVELIVKGSDL